MEDGLNEAVSCPTVIGNVNNGLDTTIMSNFPVGTVAVTKDQKSNIFEVESKLNGSVHSSDEADDDSETDALVIDESVPKRRFKKQKRGIKSKGVDETSALDKESEVVVHSNPYFNESIFELSQQHHNSHETETSLKTDKNKTVVRANKLKKVKPKNSPKLREYAQYLGLQPAVQFKCSKCQQAGFESLPSLNEHFLNCTADPNATREVQDSSVSSFKLTRRVFLCSACGTYYENWNLYMHMVEFHRRFICLYCLGMFSVLEDLCQHIQSRHNWEPQQRETPDDFFKEYKEPCFIICCECKQLFNERDNFFYHNCVQCDNGSVVKNINSKNIKCKSVKQQIRPENHVTGDSIADNCSEINPKTNLVEVISEPTDTESNIPMVRSEHNNTETSEVVPEVPSFDSKSTEMNSHTSLADLDEIETSQNLELTEKHDSELDESLSMETNDKQASLNLTSEFVNSSAEDLSKENFEDDVKSADDFQTEGYNQSSRDSDLKSMDEENSDLDENMSEQFDNMNREETRKVPKLSLKLPKLDAFSNVEPEDSDDSEKLGMEVDQIESENEYYNPSDEKVENTSCDNSIPVAGPEVAIVELELEQPLDKFEIKVLLQKCLSATVPVCVYCNHARKIAVNGKQLGLHAIAEHRYSAIVNSITAEELIPESFVTRIKESLSELENTFFNLESNLSEEAVTFSHVFECFQCRYATNVHKELYLHNRKMHTKNLLICIMCKSNFYNYSELICHLCPGDYVLNYELQFRCCMCFTDDLPSSFRLMVHLRKKHHACDVCLEMCHNQYKLSNHVWKHKLHHFCYRCGIAYRNKQDITRHLFWKHGTESVLCKKCLQKKWPHVFHFCIPPTLFTCDECNLNFSRAVYLKVHKRIHFNEKPHLCTFDECGESFISKKLLQKHERQHFEPQEDEKIVEKQSEIKEENLEEDRQGMGANETTEEKTEDKPKPKIDVYDLPELNLSESSDSESENETAPKQELKKTEEEDIIETLDERTLEVEQELANNVTIANVENQVANHSLIESSVPILESIWDDFKIYQAKKEKIDNLFGDPERASMTEGDPEQGLTADVALRDHDYFYNPEMSQDTNVITEVEPDLSQRVDHDYCTPKGATDPVEDKLQESEKVDEEAKKPNLDSSSSDSDSSSCSCGSNCSCSSSSSSSSSSDSTDSDSSTEEGRRKQQERRDKKKKLKINKEEAASTTRGLVAVEKKPVLDAPILETDLDTTESETDEEFYDKQPQILAKKLLEEKRNQIIAEAGHMLNGSFENSRNSTPSLPDEIKPKKKSKSKKRKKKKSERREVEATENVGNDPRDTPRLFYQTPTVAPLTISLNKMSPLATQGASTPPSVHIKLTQEQTPIHDNEVNKRASKRRRVPNKFYGYSSDEEGEKQSTPSVPKWRKTEMQASHHQPPPMLVPPITIKTGHAISQPTVEPITIRPTAKSGELRVHQRQSHAAPRVPPLQINAALLAKPDDDDERESDSNESATEENEDAVVLPLKETKNVQLYCYCRCPYDEVSEMIGCDSHDCAIEWFHFECVGIMVPPKGQWFCPDCRKRKQQRRELLQT
ncbi:hypothetical protein WA026_012268 [Henosepilachna vigintioctopunctata]|uniref:Chromatin modification-related protein YNG2 n=1 Tax=Henosepilachna vigintioctopunctata TaxID=420089 RepID=A0AAW1VFT3_9CUCU